MAKIAGQYGVESIPVSAPRFVPEGGNGARSDIMEPVTIGALIGSALKGGLGPGALIGSALKGGLGPFLGWLGGRRTENRLERSLRAQEREWARQTQFAKQLREDDLLSKRLARREDQRRWRAMDELRHQRAMEERVALKNAQDFDAPLIATSRHVLGDATQQVVPDYSPYAPFLTDAKDIRRG
jgi:hypothetical protein